MKKPSWSSLNTLRDQRQVQRQVEERKTLGDISSYQELTCQHGQEVVQDSTYQIWQAHSDLAEGPG